ncbi:threonine/homoserine/homoserine lactone efflux protein [Marinomonas pollencensis]|uniref:Threonine/homoserine/homoserine lactone efflux protein n=2 Tax=Marinomonas pollencensis TaxID=491954 RepID=A0A3E0DF08_9GAMM|nr:threonine/homoserine/homoserine lactone efflux protein [Marinomonas pollencensis]
MTFSVWLAMAPLLMLLSLGPGPNNFTAMHNGIQVGARKAVIAVVGRNLAFSILMLVSALGLGAIIVSSSFWFGVVKWAGVAYLFYVGVKTWRSAAVVLEEHESENDGKVKRGHKARIQQEFFVAISNPKAILLFTAIFPQLLDLNQPVAAQFFWMGLTFCMTEFIAAYVYAMSGKQIRRLIRSPKGMRNMNRGMGSVFVLASAFLATASRV